jgi:hypothetical protein
LVLLLAWDTWWPDCQPLPVNSQRRDMILSNSNVKRRRHVALRQCCAVHSDMWQCGQAFVPTTASPHSSWSAPGADHPDYECGSSLGRRLGGSFWHVRLTWQGKRPCYGVCARTFWYVPVLTHTTDSVNKTRKTDHQRFGRASFSNGTLC